MEAVHLVTPEAVSELIVTAAAEGCRSASGPHDVMRSGRLDGRSVRAPVEGRLLEGRSGDDHGASNAADVDGTVTASIDGEGMKGRKTSERHPLDVVLRSDALFVKVLATVRLSCAPQAPSSPRRKRGELIVIV
ncbi:hypothetical protein ACFVFH_12830 [Streptomyces sp. NPDC057697]|uniref:hypothetical protein n=1 Tax=Streptomyces sp. NPDC057697 TaxID=3346219 RepID=UPI00368511AB